MTQRTEYRCTRQALYTHDCIGRDQTSARQGHYIVAEDMPSAIDEMVDRYPEDYSKGFTIQQCKPVRGKLFEWTPARGFRRSQKGGMS